MGYASVASQEAGNARSQLRKIPRIRMLIAGARAPIDTLFFWQRPDRAFLFWFGHRQKTDRSGAAEAKLHFTGCVWKSAEKQAVRSFRGGDDFKGRVGTLQEVMDSGHRTGKGICTDSAILPGAFRKHYKDAGRRGKRGGDICRTRIWAKPGWKAERNYCCSRDWKGAFDGCFGRQSCSRTLAARKRYLASLRQNIQSAATDAYKNMGLSASDYMATANKMGSLFQGSGLEQQRART